MSLETEVHAKWCTSFSVVSFRPEIDREEVNRVGVKGLFLVRGPDGT